MAELDVDKECDRTSGLPDKFSDLAVFGHVDLYFHCQHEFKLFWLTDDQNHVILSFENKIRLLVHLLSFLDFRHRNE